MKILNLNIRIFLCQIPGTWSTNDFFSAKDSRGCWRGCWRGWSRKELRIVLTGLKPYTTSLGPGGANCFLLLNFFSRCSLKGLLTASSSSVSAFSELLTSELHASEILTNTDNTEKTMTIWVVGVILPGSLLTNWGWSSLHTADLWPTCRIIH